MAIGDYISDKELMNYIYGAAPTGDSLVQSATKIMSTKTRGIEGLPYQFMGSVDRRITGSEVGRKYGERIFGRLPLLFLTPCEPLFMDDFDKQSKSNVLSALGSAITGNSISNLNELISGAGRYYSVNFDYATYYEYLNTMLASVSAYLGIFDTKISVGDSEPKRIGTIDWSNELNSSFKTFFTCKENIIFYLDGLDSISEQFSNTTTESALASTINGFADTTNEIRFLMGNGSSAASSLMSSATNITSSITSSLSKAMTNLGGGIVGSLADKGVNTVLNGGKIVFPEIWSDSEFSRSYTINIKLRSPDHDSLSIFLNILKPYCKLLCLTMPKQNMVNGEVDPNSYSSPFLVKAYSKGMFNIDMGIITGLSVEKGATCAWNDDGLPTQIDISLEIKDLYSHLGMSSMSIENPVSSIKNVVNNTAYMDFLANMAGLNIAQMEVGRRVSMIYYLTQTMVATAPSNIYNRLDQAISGAINKMYNIF